MQLESKLTIEYSCRECQGIWAEWSFDDFFSSSIIKGYDLNRDGSFNAEETQMVRDNAFENLKNYGYFVFLRKGGARRNPKKVQKFSVWQEKGRLFYKFFVPLTGQGYGENFSFSIFDSTYFCAVKYAEEPVVIEQEGEGDAPVYELVKNKKYPVYYNPMGAANDMRTYEKWAPGLEKAYPEEIHVYFNE